MPPVDEHRRHDLYDALEDAIGRENAETLMTMFPPSPWEDVATKSDLAVFEHRIRSELHQELRAQTRTLMLGLVGSLATMTSLCLAAVGLAT